MRFYHWGWEEVMNLPLQAFWTCLRAMQRLRAQENLRLAKLICLPNITEDARKEFFEQQAQILGVVAVETPVRDPNAISKLKQISG
jgi:hypothetical protein